MNNWQSSIIYIRIGTSVNMLSLSSSIKVKVLYFAQAREASGTRKEEIVLVYPATLNILFAKILEKHPDIEHLSGLIALSVNRKVINKNVKLKEGDEVALLPPVTGG
jgi:molybdopterin converting factor subunit 1